MTTSRATGAFMLVVISAVLLAGSARAQQDESAISWVDCPAAFAALPNAYPASISCGWLPVLEDRAAPTGKMINLFVTLVAATEERALPPLIYLAGGPGDAASSEIHPWLAADLNQRQDTIFIDQRGSGLSKPSLNCPELDQPGGEDRLILCRDRLLAEGINLAAYNSESITKDVLELIAAMRLKSVNIYGRSFGTRLALRVAEQLPAGLNLNALALDGAYPPGKSAIEAVAANTQQSLRRLFADCGADPDCASAYPNLDSQFETAAAKLNGAPVEIDGLLPRAALHLDSAGFLQILRQMLADSRSLPYIPAFIAAIAQGDYAALSELEILHFAGESSEIDPQSEGLYMNVFCADEAATASAEKISAAAEYLPAIFAPMSRATLELLADCAKWMAPLAGPAQTIPSLPPVPILLLAGRYDPVTPDASIFASASPSWRYTDPRAGHGVLLRSKCAQLITLAFLSEPTAPPQHSCLREGPPLEFYIGQNE